MYGDEHCERHSLNSTTKGDPVGCVAERDTTAMANVYLAKAQARELEAIGPSTHFGTKKTPHESESCFAI